jgi:outer membrane protein assembly factor BamB
MTASRARATMASTLRMRRTQEREGNMNAHRRIVRGACGLALAVSLLVSAGSASATARSPGAWSQFGHDAARTGSNPFETALAPPFTAAWGHAGYGESYPDVIESAGVVLGYGNTHLIAVDAATGLTRWQQAGEGLYVAAAAEGGIGYAVDDRDGAYLSGRDPLLVAFRLADGAVLWQQPGGVPAAYVANPCASPALARNALFVATASYDRSVDPPHATWSVRAYDARSGAALWRQPPTFASPVCAPSVAGKSVYVVAEGPGGGSSLVALDAATGQVRWSAGLPSGTPPTDAPVIAHGRAYLVGANDGAGTRSLVIVNLAKHAVARVVRVPIDRRPTVDGAGDVYATACGSLSKLDARGNLLDSVVVDDTEGCGEGQSTPLANGFLYVVEFDDAYVFDARSLALVDDVGVGGFVGSPIVADGQLLIGGDFGISAWRAR